MSLSAFHYCTDWASAVPSPKHVANCGCPCTVHFAGNASWQAPVAKGTRQGRTLGADAKARQFLTRGQNLSLWADIRGIVDPNSNQCFDIMFQFGLQFFRPSAQKPFERTAVNVINGQLLKSQAFGLLQANVFPLTPVTSCCKVSGTRCQSCVLPMAKRLSVKNRNGPKGLGSVGQNFFFNGSKPTIQKNLAPF